MPHKQWTLLVEPQAPPKPHWGAPCNGCGICCLVEPCPLGIALSRRRSGACVALRWSPLSSTYTCGALTHTTEVVALALPRALQGLAASLAPALRSLAPRWIAAGAGCDSHLVAAAPTMADGAAGLRTMTGNTLQQPPP